MGLGIVISCEIGILSCIKRCQGVSLGSGTGENPCIMDSVSILASCYLLRLGRGVDKRWRKVAHFHFQALGCFDPAGNEEYESLFLGRAT